MAEVILEQNVDPGWVDHLLDASTRVVQTFISTSNVTMAIPYQAVSIHWYVVMYILSTGTLSCIVQGKFRMIVVSPTTSYSPFYLLNGMER